MDLLIQALTAFILSVALSLTAHHLKTLTVSGTITAASVGTITGTLGSLKWLFVFILFTVIGLAVTYFDIKRKIRNGTQEGICGERCWKNVLGVGMPPMIVATMTFVYGTSLELSVAFIATITVAAADTVASEIGIKDRKVWKLPTFERTEPGVNGGISVLGTGTSSVASLIIALIAWIIIYGSFDWIFLIPAFAGMFGNFLDSLVGGTLETSGYISKYGNNCVTALVGAAFAVTICSMI